jgi:hypothetical protein
MVRLVLFLVVMMFPFPKDGTVLDGMRGQSAFMQHSDSTLT